MKRTENWGRKAAWMELLSLIPCLAILHLKKVHMQTLKAKTQNFYITLWAGE